MLFRKKLSRGKLHGFLASQPRCVVAMEACGSAHYWGRETLELGHQVKLVPPIYVKPFVKRQKNDTADAEVIVEAAQRPTMSFVAVKTEAQQASGMLFHTRDLLVRQRTQAINALRGHLAEFGVVAPQGTAHIGRLASVLEDPESGLPEMVRELGSILLDQILGLDSKIERLGTELRACAHEDEAAVRLMTIPGVGRITTAGLRTADGELPPWPRLRSMAGSGSASAYDRGEAAAGQNIEDGPTRSQEVVDQWGHGSGPARGATRRISGPVAQQHALAKAEDACRGCAGEQDGARRVGGDDDGGRLPGSRRRLSRGSSKSLGM